MWIAIFLVLGLVVALTVLVLELKKALAASGARWWRLKRRLWQRWVSVRDRLLNGSPPRERMCTEGFGGDSTCDVPMDVLVLRLPTISEVVARPRAELEQAEDLVEARLGADDSDDELDPVSEVRAKVPAPLVSRPGELVTSEQYAAAPPLPGSEPDDVVQTLSVDVDLDDLTDTQESVSVTWEEAGLLLALAAPEIPSDPGWDLRATEPKERLATSEIPPAPAPSLSDLEDTYPHRLIAG